MSIGIDPGLAYAASLAEAGLQPYPGNLLILGTSTEGELFVPVLVTSLEEARDFGAGELVDAFAQVLQAGQDRAYLVRIGASFAGDTERQAALREAYRHLVDFPAHVVVPLGAVTGRGYAEDLADFLSRSSPVGYALGVLSTPDIDPDDVKGSLAQILSAPELQGALGGRGKVLCAVASPVIMGGQLIRPQAIYGAVLSTLPVGTSPTNVPVLGIDVPWSLDEDDWDQVLAAGITAWQRRPYRSVHVATALTLGQPPFRLQSTMRCLQALIERLEAVGDVYIGRLSLGAGRERALEEDIRSALENARQLGWLRSFAVQFDWKRAQGELEVMLELSLWHEINTIRFSHHVQVT